MLILFPELRIDLRQQLIVVLNVLALLVNRGQHVIPTGAAAPVLPIALDCKGQALTIERAIGAFSSFPLNRPWRVPVQQLTPVLQSMVEKGP